MSCITGVVRSIMGQDSAGKRGNCEELEAEHGDNSNLFEWLRIWVELSLDMLRLNGCSYRE